MSTFTCSQSWQTEGAATIRVAAPFRSDAAAAAARGCGSRRPASSLSRGEGFARETGAASTETALCFMSTVSVRRLCARRRLAGVLRYGCPYGLTQRHLLRSARGRRVGQAPHAERVEQPDQTGQDRDEQRDLKRTVPGLLVDVEDLGLNGLRLVGQHDGELRIAHHLGVV